MKLKSAKTVQGQEVKIDASKWNLHKTVKINDANVVKESKQTLLQTTALSHVIDKVLLPK
ncbi:MAG: fasciclin domain-containing protein [Candidatus Bathyarchaeia archaeon]